MRYKKDKITKSDVEYKLNKVLALKLKRDELLKSEMETANQIKILDEKINKGLEVVKGMKEKVVPDDRKPDRIIKNYSTEVEALIRKTIGKRLFEYVNKKFPKVIKFLNIVGEKYDDAEIWICVRYRRVKEVTRKVVRMVPRVIEWAPVLYEDWDWGFNSILDIMLFKLNKLQKCLDEGHYIGCEVQAREVRIAIEHIKRYKDIGDYTIDYEYDREIDGFNFEVVQVDENNRPTLYTHTERDPKRAEKRMRIHMAQERLSQWHWQQLWKLINEKAQGWLD